MEGVEIRQAHPFYPQGSPVSSERPEYPQRGGEEGSWTLPVTWLAANVGWGGGSSTIRIGPQRWQLASEKEK